MNYIEHFAIYACFIGLGRDSYGPNPSKMKKPKPTDPLHPNKGDFIRAKHASLAFVYRPAKDEPLVTEAELSRQLHSSVRTPNLETSLRLLSQGGDPNFYHPEKNSTPLQVCSNYSAKAFPDFFKKWINVLIPECWKL